MVSDFLMVFGYMPAKNRLSNNKAFRRPFLNFNHKPNYFRYLLSNGELIFRSSY